MLGAMLAALEVLVEALASIKIPLSVPAKGVALHRHVFEEQMQDEARSTARCEHARTHTRTCAVGRDGLILGAGNIGRGRIHGRNSADGPIARQLIDPPVAGNQLPVVYEGFVHECRQSHAPAALHLPRLHRVVYSPLLDSRRHIRLTH